MYSYSQAGRVTGQRLLVDNWVGNTVADLQAQYSWDNQGRMTQMTYPSGGPKLNYTFDAMGRLSGMACDSGSPVCGVGNPQVASASYGSARQLTALTYDAITETRSYNNMLQLTRMTASNGSNLMDVQYIYPMGHNGGRVSQTIDGVTGETVSYQYDSLNRLISAASSGGVVWSQSYTYDGFGNLTATAGTGGAPSWSMQVNPATNQPVQAGYDANGNANGSVDVENRVIATPGGGYWTYDPQGKRVFANQPGSNGETRANTTCQIYFYGITGQKLTTYNCTMGDATDAGGLATLTFQTYNLYFGGKLIRSNGTTVATDRLGSVRWNGSAVVAYYPYGQERTSTPDGAVKFGGYYRDGPGQDYAGKRYYSGLTGRYWSPEQYKFDPSTPTSWNAYLYVKGDPVNHNNPNGGEEAAAPGCYEDPFNLEGDCEGYPGPAGIYVGNGNSYDQGRGSGALLNSQKKIRGIATAVNRLSNSACAKALGSTSAKATNTLQTAKIADVSLPFSVTFNEAADGSYTYLVDYTAARAPGDGSIQLNSNPALNDPSKILVGMLVNGKQVFDNLLTGMENQYGLKAGSMTTDLFWAIYDLHELGHVLGGLVNDGTSLDKSEANTATVIDNCFKDLLKQ